MSWLAHSEVFDLVNKVIRLENFVRGPDKSFFSGNQMFSKTVYWLVASILIRIT